MRKRKEVYPNAVVTEIDGRLVLEDPIAYAMICAVNKHNCKNTYDLNLDRIEYFKKRIVEKGLSPDDVVIVVINADDVNGGLVADILMPGFNWQEIRDRGEIPFARGIANRDGIRKILEAFDYEAACKLDKAIDVAVVVIDNQVAEVFSNLPYDEVAQFLPVQQRGTPDYVYKHGLSKIKRGKNPSAWLSLGNGIIVKNPKAAFYLAKLLIGDTKETLLGKPFLRSEINWADEYEKHLKGPDAGIPFSPTSGIDNCICAICFYRDAPPPHNPKHECQMVSRNPQKLFGFIGPAKNVFMPPVINGKDLGHYCPQWLNPEAE